MKSGEELSAKARRLDTTPPVRSDRKDGSGSTAAVRVRPDECRLVAPRERLNEAADRRLAGVKLTLSDKCRISAADPKPTIVTCSTSLSLAPHR